MIHIRHLWLLLTSLIIGISVCSGAIRPVQKPPLYEKYRDLSLEKLYDKGMDFFRQEQNDSAILILTLVAQRDTLHIDSLSRKLMAKARNTLGIISYNQSNYPVAYTHFLESIKLDDTPDAKGYLSMASVFLRYGDETRAFEYLKNYTSHAIARHHYNEASLGIANIISTNFTRAGIPPDTITDIVRKYLALPSAAREAKAYPLASHLARSWMAGYENRPLDGVAEIKAAISELEGVMMPRTRHALFLVIADQYMQAGQKDSSLAYISRAESLAMSNDLKDLLSITYSDAARIHDFFGDNAMSELYHHKMLEINDSIFNPRELGKLHDLNKFYEVNKFERRIEMMNMRDRMRLTVLWTVAIALAIVLTLLIIMFRQNHALRSKTRILFERNLSEMRAEKAILSAPAHHDDEDRNLLPEGAKAQDTADPEDGGNDPADPDKDRKYVSSNLSDETRERVRRCIEEVFRDESIFCQEGFTLNDLAKICKSNSRYVSQVINEDMNTSFTQLLNMERVKVARNRFMDVEHYGHLTIEAIISNLGCKSRSTFSKTFKRITGLKPSEFQRMARDRAGSNPDTPR